MQTAYKYLLPFQYSSCVGSMCIKATHAQNLGTVVASQATA